MDIYLLYILLNYSANKVNIPKLLRHVFEKYENLDIDLFLNVFDFACTPEKETIVNSELLNMHSDFQRMKVI